MVDIWVDKKRKAFHVPTALTIDIDDPNGLAEMQVTGLDVNPSVLATLTALEGRFLRKACSTSDGHLNGREPEFELVRDPGTARLKMRFASQRS